MVRFKWEAVGRALHSSSPIKWQFSSNIPSHLGELWPLFSQEEGLATSFGLSEWTVMSNHSPQVPSQHRVPTQGSQTTDPKPQGLCTGCAPCLEYSALTCSPPLPVSYIFFRPKSALSSAFWSHHPELVVFSVWEERRWWIQCLPSTKPVCLPLALSETSLINRPVGTCLNFPGSMRTNEVSGSGAAQRKHLKVCSFFFSQDQTFPRLWKHSTLSF